METRRAYLIKVKQQIEASITGCYVTVRHDGERVKFYNGSTGCYISLKNRDAFIEASRNRFYKEAVKLINMELNKENVTFTYEAAFARLPEEVRARITLNELLRDRYVEKWINRYYPTMGVPEGVGFYTAGGDHVRSKSEVIIADMLKRYGVPYHYEPTLNFDSQCKSPDFLILNTRNRKEYLWEHLGMMDNSDYCSEAIEKISFYSTYGYYTGENLIITMECSKHPIDTRYAESLIKKYLI